MEKLKQTAYALEVTCDRCGEPWTLNPKKWKNTGTVEKIGKKRLTCPYCNNKSFLNKKQTRELMKQKKRYENFVASQSP